ncbi:MAG: 16S rRNA (cytosine(967)-C(5))-methyltransferase RsmB [Lachnospiraceae bacterium]|nr:16S rRNA (cytosine(967)-C(5))-methyltransferase RsmB [Lachnospiraceae bacterium]
MTGAAGKGAAPGRHARETDQREIVLSILQRVHRDGVFSHVAVREALEAADGMDRSRKAFIKRLAEGVLERRDELDALIRRHSTGRGKTKPLLQDIMRIGLYQILYMDSVPDSAACNEAVKMVKRRGRKDQAGYVNGVLRAVCREKERLKENKDSKDLREQGLQYAMPAWIRNMWIRQYGARKTDALTAALMEVRPVTIRLDERLDSQEREQVLHEIALQGAEAAPGRYLPYCFRLEKTSDLRRLPGFASGSWTVQDESSMLVTEAAGLRGGETVIDVCAAPGGKALHMASRLAALEKETGKRGKVLAFDKNTEKTARIAANAKRMKLDNLNVSVRDARRPDPALEGTADVVLCDLPCSGLGVTGKKNDIKYRITQEQIGALVLLQREILRAAARLVKPGGVLLYSTCTINKRENDDNAAFLASETGLRPDPLAPHLPAGLVEGESCRLQLFPDTHGTDGFFIARFVRPEQGAEMRPEQERGQDA